MRRLRHPGARLPAGGLALFMALLGAGVAVAQGLPDTVRRTKPGVVAVGTYEALRRPPARPMGSGFAVADGRHVVTNNHVLAKELDAKNNEHLAVFVSVGFDIRMMRVEIVDRDPDHDLALLRLSKGALLALPLAGDGDVAEGQSIAITGFPLAGILGLYPITHRGIVAAIKPAAIPVVSPRQLNSQAIQAIRNRVEVYQLDITAFPGNSGSPVYDAASGRVIGIVNSVLVHGVKKDLAITQPTGITYAIPVRYLRQLLKKNGIPVL